MNTRIPPDTTPPAPRNPDEPLSMIAAVTTHLSGAYDGLKYSQRHRITGHVALTDFNYIFLDHLPAQGMQNKVISGLFYSFARAFRAALAADPTINPYVLAIELTNNVSYGHHKDTHPR